MKINPSMFVRLSKCLTALMILFLPSAGGFAQTNALCVVAALKGLKENPMANFFSEKADGVPPADFSTPAPAVVPAADKVLLQ